MIISGSDLPNETVDLCTPYGEIPLVKIGDFAFSRFPWLMKGFNSNTVNLKERLYNLKLSSALAVTENACGMLKSRWQILY